MESISRHSYPTPLDAIVLAGTDDNPRRLIHGENKCFLEIGGQVLVRRVVNALLEARSVGQIFVVGPKDRLEAVLEGMPASVNIVQQAGKMLSNAWAAIHALEASHRERHGSDDPNQPLLFLSSDLPLITAQAVEDFVDRCASEDYRQELKYAMLTGVAEESSLNNYYPGQSGEGIVRPYVHMSDCRVRLANIYVGRPRTLRNQEFLQTGFEHRKAEKWKNVLYLAWTFLSQDGGLKATWITMKLQATLLARRGPGWLYRRLRKRNTRQRIEKICGQVLGGDVRMVITPYGGLSLDVDSEEDYRLLSQNYEAWSQIEAAEDSPV
jgi:GTP:adenosylcobinamide-phosphate guanylyltransferase